MVAKVRPIFFGGIAALVALTLSLLWISNDDLWKEAASPSERLETVTKTYSSLLIVLGFGFAYRRLQVADRQVKVAEEGQLTERFGSAVEQLASAALSVRIGGLYSLERLSKDSPSFHWPSVEIISSFIKDRSKRFSNVESQGELDAAEQINLVEDSSPLLHADTLNAPRRAPLDVQVAMRIISRRDYRLDPEGLRIDLEGAFLAGIRLNRAFLREANLSEADLSGVLIRDSDLSGASFVSCNMAEAELKRVNLSNADASWVKLNACDLRYSDLSGSEFRDADLSSCGLMGTKARGTSFRRAQVDFADFTDANLEKANFEGVDCLNTVGLTSAQLSSLEERPRIEPQHELDS